ncbi:MAG: hypothetical protein JXN64_11360 [Spirochaetes bacterium]|nr:hypothetical protein [Spirochaetota bacterium]
MKKLIPVILIFSLASWFFDSDKKQDTAKDTVIEKKWFKNNNTFVIICRGWPNESLSGKARVDSAKEAALMNAQFCAKDLFDKTVDVVRNGTIVKYTIYDDYVTIEYSIQQNGLRKHYKESDK